MNSEQNNYFFVGTKFGDDDYLEYFMKEGKWELGWHNNEENKQYQKMLKLFNKIKPGDVLFAKSTYVKKKNLPFVKKDDSKVSVMKIRGMATVKEVLDDGHTIIVDWKKEYIEREWFFFTGQQTIWFPSDIKYRITETNQLIKFATSDEIIIQDYNYFLNHPNWKKYKKLESETMVKNDFLIRYGDILKKSKNIILRGAPGTGKTYLARQIANMLTGGNEEQIDFVQFHPSYDYTDFVEGLRPLPSDDGQISFGLQDGIFKKFCERAKLAQKTGGQDNFEEAWESYLEFINTTEEKEYLTKTSYLSVNSRQNLSVNYDSGASGWTLPRHYVYELYKNKNYDKQRYYKSSGKTVLKVLKERFALKTYKEAAEISSIKNFIFIIDEINRGEISKIFGELFSPLIRAIVGRMERFRPNMLIYMKLLRSFISLKMST